MRRTGVCVLTAVVFATLPLLSARAETPAPVDLLRDIAWQYSRDGGKTFSDQPGEIGPKDAVLARAEFDSSDVPSPAWLELSHELPGSVQAAFRLNGQALQGPLEGMNYRTIPALDAGMLRKGRNALEATLKAAKAKPPPPATVRASLCLMLPAHLRFQTAPVLGCVGADYFTVSCRTNLPAKVTIGHIRTSGAKVGMLSVDGESFGLIHRFRVKVNGADSYDYQLDAAAGGAARASASGRVVVPAPGKPLRFVALGDNRTNVKDWAQVASAARAVGGALTIHVGDMVTAGRNDWEWDEQFFAPAAELFAAAPLFPVIGNHEQSAPLYDAFFAVPDGDAKARSWAQQVGDVLLIGIDGRADWSADSANARWLEAQLAGAKAKFIFLVNHYPAWTSGGHGGLDAEGKPKELATRQGQEVIFPLLQKYRATALIAGHDHLYERSEPPGGVSHIITGGAGAPLRGKAKDAEKQNPHSKVFASTLHYCVFDVRDDRCEMKVFTPDGQLLDQRAWDARK